jgi:hypothetical protein
LHRLAAARALLSRMAKVENDQRLPGVERGALRFDPATFLTPTDKGRQPISPNKPQQRADDDKCAACRGTGVIVLLNPVAPETKQPPVCPRCVGTGRAPMGQRQAIRCP